MILAAEQLTELFEADEIAWLETMAELIANGEHGELDYGHLQELLTDMANRERNEVESRIVVLIAHLLKWTHQKKKRTGSWRATIYLQRDELGRILKSRTLRNHADEVLSATYKSGVKAAALETGLATGAFPKKCPWTLETLLANDDLEE